MLLMLAETVCCVEVLINLTHSCVEYSSCCAVGVNVIVRVPEDEFGKEPAE
jgi:hypothetical protein